MGLLDSILGSVMSGGQGHSSGQAALINAVVQLITNESSGGGLAGLVSALSQGGLGNIASSWVSTGANLPVSAEQLQSALGGNGLLAQLARSAGLSQGDVASGLAPVLPDLVDKLTPDGHIPPQGSLEKLLGSFNIGR